MTIKYLRGLGEFNNISGIENAWKDAHYDVTLCQIKSTPCDKKRKSKADLMKEAVDLLSDLDTNKAAYQGVTASKKLQQIQETCPLAIDAYYGLGVDAIKDLNYNEKKINEALREYHNKAAEARVLAYLNSRYQNGKYYLISDMVRDLRFAYNKYRVRNIKTGEIKIAKATQFNDPGRFKAYKTKKLINGKLEHVNLIQERLFNLSNVA